MAAAEQKKVLEQQVIILNQRISIHEQVIKEHVEKDSITVASYEKELKELNSIRAIHEDQIKTMEKMIIKEKRKRFWSTAAGTLTTAGALYLFITK